MYGISFAASEYERLCLDYLNELNKKIFQGNQNLTAIINETRKLNENDIKKNEIAKASRRRDPEQLSSQNCSSKTVIMSINYDSDNDSDNEHQQQTYILDTNVNIIRDQEVSTGTNTITRTPSYNPFHLKCTHQRCLMFKQP